jgi:hypothetical protein
MVHGSIVIKTTALAEEEKGMAKSQPDNRIECLQGGALGGQATTTTQQ